MSEVRVGRDDTFPATVGWVVRLAVSVEGGKVVPF